MLATPPNRVSSATRPRARARGISRVRASLKRVIVLCILLGISEPLLADSCVPPDAAVGARISSSESQSSVPAGGQDMHGSHLCHCAHMHAGILRQPVRAAAQPAQAGGRIPSPPDELRSGPPAQPLLRPPLRS